MGPNVTTNTNVVSSDGVIRVPALTAQSESPPGLMFAPYETDAPFSPEERDRRRAENKRARASRKRNRR